MTYPLSSLWCGVLTSKEKPLNFLLLISRALSATPFQLSESVDEVLLEILVYIKVTYYTLKPVSDEFSKLHSCWNFYQLHNTSKHIGLGEQLQESGGWSASVAVFAELLMQIQIPKFPLKAIPQYIWPNQKPLPGVAYTFLLYFKCIASLLCVFRFAVFLSI